MHILSYSCSILYFFFFFFIIQLLQVRDEGFEPLVSLYRRPVNATKLQSSWLWFRIYVDDPLLCTQIFYEKSVKDTNAPHIQFFWMPYQKIKGWFYILKISFYIYFLEKKLMPYNIWLEINEINKEKESRAAGWKDKYSSMNKHSELFTYQKINK